MRNSETEIEAEAEAVAEQQEIESTENERLIDQQIKEKEKPKWREELQSKLCDAQKKAQSNDHIIIEFTDTDIKAELCIFRVPEKLKKVKEDAYSPRVVAIGPLHRHNVNFALRLQQKMDYTSSLLCQLPAGDFTELLNECIEAIQEMDEAIRECYTEKIDLTRNELVEMMLLDGCFILELFLRCLENEHKSDPVLKSAWTLTALKHDLALLENQIPFFILDTLYGIVWPSIMKRGYTAPSSVGSLALTFFNPMSLRKTEGDPHIGCRHLLDLLHKFYFPQDPAASVFSISGDIDYNKPATNYKWGFKKCASELLESGIEFKKGLSTGESLLNITLNQDGEVAIPKLVIHDTTSISLFRNLIAFEQCSLSSRQSVTSYAFLMRSLISSPRDSKLLKKRGIIWHRSNGDENYLATKFASMLEGVDLVGDFYFRKVCHEVNEYRKCWCSLRRLNVFVRKQTWVLWKDYLTSAWKVMSILAAIIILVLTFLQTYYTIQSAGN